MKTRKYNKRIENITPEILSRIAKIDEIKGSWKQGVNLSTQILGRLKKSVLITSAGASTRIEGSELTDSDIENFINGLRINKFSDRDKQEVQGYYELLENVFNSWSTILISESSIKSLHRELLKYVEKDIRHRGEYKKIENNVTMVDAQGKEIGVVFKTTPAYLTPKQMEELLSWTQSAISEEKYHPLLIIANFLIEFLKIHPFQDGNGRLSRILTNLLLLKFGYDFAPYISHEKIIEDSKSAYYLALRKSQKTLDGSGENIIVWLEYFLDVLKTQAQLAMELLSTENIEIFLSPKQLIVWNYISEIQEVSAGEIVKQTKIARPTVNQSLEKLLAMKKIERIGQGSATRYKIVK